MSSFLDRSNYLKKIANYSKTIADQRDLGEGVRNSFHRINDEEELLSACQNWGHFPCVVHIGHDGRFDDNQGQTPKNVVSTHLYFLDTLNLDTYPNKADAIEAAYDSSFTAAMQFLSFMKEDIEENGSTGNLYSFSLSGTKYDMLSGINQKLYGWYFILTDRMPELGLIFNTSNFFKGVHDETL